MKNVQCDEVQGPRKKRVSKAVVQLYLNSSSSCPEVCPEINLPLAVAGSLASQDLNAGPLLSALRRKGPLRPQTC